MDRSGQVGVTEKTRGGPDWPGGCHRKIGGGPEWPGGCHRKDEGLSGVARWVSLREHYELPGRCLGRKLIAVRRVHLSVI